MRGGPFKCHPGMYATPINIETPFTPTTPVWLFLWTHSSGIPQEAWEGGSPEGCRTDLLVAERRKGGIVTFSRSPRYGRCVCLALPECAKSTIEGKQQQTMSGPSQSPPDSSLDEATEEGFILVSGYEGPSYCDNP